MKNFIFILFSILLLGSCTKNDNESLETIAILTKINGTFKHTIPNCDNADPNLNCAEYIWFNDNSTEASIMYGGSDFGIPFSYTLKVNMIDFYLSNGNKSDFSFEIIDKNTLKRIGNNNIWKREE